MQSIGPHVRGDGPVTESGGVGYGETNSEGEKYTEQVDEVLAKIESGEIADIPTTPQK